VNRRENPAFFHAPGHFSGLTPCCKKSFAFPAEVV
jgi:hypothetical protein